jgi:hypothetical protein
MPIVLSGQPNEVRRKLRAQKGVAVRRGDKTEASRLDAEIRTEALAAHIESVVDEFPPLSGEQRERLAALLRPTAGGAA